ncbi:5-deoxy-glucuronate isomerase [Porticoccus sp. W117]|uniref:5-deoxy-glucuronate isomerase n=1 Tax=Porticoccus sp. W117 TaxID=3054777 RepID=UPI0025956EB6|nr:5-deoxy-glucuronate isomerase [Porticoccus sp. W117]MDM3870087.1 5-deoxy-glucuronate isomerase [Porticoccus sp. W117]
MHNKNYRQGFPPGLTWVTDHKTDVTGIGFGVLNMAVGESLSLQLDAECAWLLMSGRVVLSSPELGSIEVHRSSLFDDKPVALHTSAGCRVQIECIEPAELTLYQTENSCKFSERLYSPEETTCEQRGKGSVGDTCWREVRTIFGLGDSFPESNLVLGEVITFPGRWSSYPPHHHPQPEIYHYRFSEPQGYGHAELGEDVVKVQQFDTVKILSPDDHAQCAAPGYGMYYSWVIRHLPDNRYLEPEFTEAHKWVMNPAAQYWKPKNS